LQGEVTWGNLGRYIPSVLLVLTAFVYIPLTLYDIIMHVSDATVMVCRPQQVMSLAETMCSSTPATMSSVSSSNMPTTTIPTWLQLRMESKLERLRAELGSYMDGHDWDVDLEEEDRKELAVLKVSRC
jgi:hypothetical protein